MVARDKYQVDAGNLPHMHMMAYIKLEELNEDQIRKLNDLFRVSVCDIVRVDEVQHLIHDEIFAETKDVDDIQKDAGNILPRICNIQCKKRVAHTNNAADFQCRKTNKLKINHNNTKYCYISLPSEHTPECIQRLA